MLVSTIKVLKEYPLEQYELLDWADQGYLEMYYKHPELKGLFRVRRHNIFDQAIFPFRALRKSVGISFPEQFEQVDESSLKVIETSMDCILYNRGNSVLFNETDDAFKNANTIDFTDMLVDEGVLSALVSGFKERGSTKAGRELSDARHKETRPSAYAVNEIVSSIQNKDKTGEYWHQTIECELWLEQHPESKTSIERLRREVNKKLNVITIFPKKNAPRKK